MDPRLLWVLLVTTLAIVVSKFGTVTVKAGVVLSTRPEIVAARRIVAEVWARFGYQAVVTSGLDGVHSEGSLHPNGLAEDYRTRDVPLSVLPVMVAEVRARLGSDYDVVLESDHLHVEFDPS